MVEIDEKVGHRCLVDISISFLVQMGVVNLLNYLDVNFSGFVFSVLFSNMLDQWSINIYISSNVWNFLIWLSSEYSNITCLGAGNNKEIVRGFDLISTIISLGIWAI